jgi:hypothetical protein
VLGGDVKSALAGYAGLDHASVGEFTPLSFNRLSKHRPGFGVVSQRRPERLRVNARRGRRLGDDAQPGSRIATSLGELNASNLDQTTVTEQWAGCQDPVPVEKRLRQREPPFRVNSRGIKASGSTTGRGSFRSCKELPVFPVHPDHCLTIANSVC